MGADPKSEPDTPARAHPGRAVLRPLFWTWVVLAALLPLLWHFGQAWTGGVGAPRPVPETAYWPDAVGDASIDQVADPFWADRFMAVSTAPSTKDATAHWYRVRLDNPESDILPVILEIGDRVSAEADLYLETQTPGTFVRQRAGLLGMGGGLLAEETAVFSLELAPRSSQFVFVRIGGGLGGLKRPIAARLWESREDFEASRRLMVAWTGFVIGILLAALAYHTALLVGLKRRETLPYVVHLLAFGLLQALLLATPTAFLPGVLRQAGQEVALGLLMASLVWFSIRFLEARKSPAVFQGLAALLIVWCVLAPAGILVSLGGSPEGIARAAAQLVVRFYDWMLVLTSVGVLLAAWVRRRRKGAWAGVFLAAFTPFLVSCAIAGIERMAAGAMSRHTLALIQASAATHMVAVSAAVALRLQRQRRMEERVRDTYTNRLETKVAIRTAELQQTSEHLAASNLQKDRLFSIIAHDLRGPLNGIVAAADRLARDPGSFSREETAAFAGDIRDAAVGLRQTLENLLAWARIQTNRFVLQPVRTSVPLLMRDLEPLFRVAARERALKLELRCEPTLEIVADYEGLKTILRNFLSNAIKVSPPGSSVTVEARVRDDAVVLSVFDEGPGMDAEGRGQLFQLSPGDRKPGTEERGAGIGLVLCAEIAARMGATIEVESAPGRGSVFRLWLASGRTQQEPVVRVRERPPAG